MAQHGREPASPRNCVRVGTLGNEHRRRLAAETNADAAFTGMQREVAIIQEERRYARSDAASGASGEGVAGEAREGTGLDHVGHSGSASGTSYVQPAPSFQILEETLPKIRKHSSERLWRVAGWSTKYLRSPRPALLRAAQHETRARVPHARQPVELLPQQPFVPCGAAHCCLVQGGGVATSARPPPAGAPVVQRGEGESPASSASPALVRRARRCRVRRMRRPVASIGPPGSGGSPSHPSGAAQQNSVRSPGLFPPPRRH